jgi:hypothetical protein
LKLADKQALNNGFGDALARGFEFALVPAVFGGAGWLIDRAVGTHLVFLLSLSVFGFVGMFAKLWIGYDAAMKRHEEEAPWRQAMEAHRANVARLKGIGK